MSFHYQNNIMEFTNESQTNIMEITHPEQPLELKGNEKGIASCKKVVQNTLQNMSIIATFGAIFTFWLQKVSKKH